jgi:hypothetical protein
MTTEMRPEPTESTVIVGEDLEQTLLDAGVKAPQARALRAAVELIVLRLRASVATKDDLALLRDDIVAMRDDLRREMDGLRREMDGLRREIDGLRREMRWTAFLLISVLGGMLIALLTRTF